MKPLCPLVNDAPRPQSHSVRSFSPAPSTTWTIGLAAVAAALMPFSPAGAIPAGPANPAITAFTTCSTHSDCQNVGYLNQSTSGYIFTPTQNVKISWLGVHDDPTIDGLYADIPVSVWEWDLSQLPITPLPLASVTVPKGTSSTKLGDFRYVELGSPLMLNAGTLYVVGAYYPIDPSTPPAPDDNLDLPQFEPFSNPTAVFQDLKWNSWLTFGQSVESGYSGAPISEMPLSTGSTAGITRGLIGPSMALSPVVPDVPGPLPLLVAPAAWGWTRRLRRQSLKPSSFKQN